ncbi:MAG: hypothetical protein PHR28_12905 [candidate division Zixibacteria bacterium]|nr:hypothetical protein [candidate division Zixibacteria bacterium]
MSIINSIIDFVGNNLPNLAGTIWTAVGVGVAYLAKRYLVPLLQVEKRRKYAGWIAAIADELTDDLKARYPEKAWLEELDRAIERLIEICGIERDIAERAIRASAVRKSDG